MKRKMDGPLGQTSSNTSLSLKKYKLMRNIGHGAFSKVKLASHLPTGCQVAIKILDRPKMEEQGMEEKVKREIKVCKLLMHPHIVRLYEVIETTNHIYMVMEYAQGGDLYDYVENYVVENRRLEEEEARKFFQQIISGLEYCHRYRVVHRDLKPENILLDSKGNLKIADFGLCNIMRDGHFLKTSCGSPNYAAPEVISNSLYAGPEVDVWSCGVILYVLLCGRLPFDDVSLPKLYEKIKKGFYTLPSRLSPGARDLIALMLIVDPLKRIRIPEIKQHHWFRVNLPNYLAVPYQHITSHPKIDREILKLLIEKEYNENHLIQSLQNKIQNEGTISYHLLLDKKSAGISNSAPDLSGYEGPYSAMQIHDPPESSTRHHFPGFNDNQAIGSGFHLQSKRTWGIGLEFASRPHQIMVEVVNALRQLKVCWKKIGQYNMKCRWSQDNFRRIDRDTGHSGLSVGNEAAECSNSVFEKVVKFEVQLYKSHEEKYLLDVQRITGPQFLFLDLCASFISRLQVL